MTSRTELEALCRKVGATFGRDSEDEIVIFWNGSEYGNGMLESVLDFAEQAREA